MNYNPDTVLELDDESFLLLLNEKVNEILPEYNFTDKNRNILHYIAQYQAKTIQDHEKNIQVLKRIESVSSSSFLRELANAQSSDSKITPLSLACFYGNFDVFKFLIQNEANVNCSDIHGYTPLHRACLRKFEERHDDYVKIVELLLQVGADINSRDIHGWLPIHDAIFMADADKNEESILKKYDKHEILDILLSNPDIKLNIDGEEEELKLIRKYSQSVLQSPLHLALEMGLYDVADKLIGKGANVVAKNLKNKLPCECADKRKLTFHMQRFLLTFLF